MNPIMRIAARVTDLGEGMQVHRTLPNRQQRMIGAWCFLDHAGPVQFETGKGMHVGAHPHIGLQTFTWMIEGEMIHRDSLGNEQIIRPGQVNLMTAGKGIAHTEDSPNEAHCLHAAQLWIALPPESEHRDPDFANYPDLPTWQDGAVQLTLLAGRYGQFAAPTQVYSPLLGMDLANKEATTIELKLEPEFEYGLMPLAGEITVEGEHFKTDELAFLPKGRQELTVQLGADSKVLLLGGEPFQQPVLIWWNFVGSTRSVIAEAQHQWEQGDARFGTVNNAGSRRLIAPPLPWTHTD